MALHLGPAAGGEQGARNVNMHLSSALIWHGSAGEVFQQRLTVGNDALVLARLRQHSQQQLVDC
ncbi:MAG TPA: hypothetical protein VMW62_07160, partial [Chloroflexota bacterium]|nr:hypothetical protein [Chloroflexota bacterium]